MITQNRLSQLQERLSPLRARLLEHPIYGRIHSLGALQQFMQHHVFAVWDFMSLLKALQRRLCCVEIPWLPPTDRFASRFVNEIVLGEESDSDGEGGFASHFELYHRAMKRCDADTRGIDAFLAELRAGSSVERALKHAAAPPFVCQFVLHTFAVIESGDVGAMAAAFTFGREDLLPDVFQRIVDELNVEAHGGLQKFKYYLHRHIELDGGEHGPLAIKLIESLCGEDNSAWQAAEDAAVESLRARIALWDGMLSVIERETA